MNHLGDTNKMVETPRTDAVWELFAIHTKLEPDVEFSTLARILERELTAANDRIKRLEEDSERLNWLLDRGLAWRDCYDDFWKEGEWLYASQSALETIDKAKEAKP